MDKRSFAEVVSGSGNDEVVPGSSNDDVVSGSVSDEVVTGSGKTIPSSVDQQSKEMKHVIAALSANGYPKSFVIDGSKPKRPSLQTPATAPDDKKGFCIFVVYLIHKQCANSELQHTHGKNSTNSIKTAFLSRDDSTSPRTPHSSPPSS